MAAGKPRLTFISYSRANKDFALGLARDLRSSGFRIWLDQLDIPPGSRWDDEVEKALDECEIFMVILTPQSAASDNVKDEIGYAIDSKKRIMPVLLENAVLPLRLRRFQYVDFTKMGYEEGIEAAKQLLRGLVSEPTLPNVSGPPASQVRTETKSTPLERISAEHPQPNQAVPRATPAPPVRQAEPQERVSRRPAGQATGSAGPQGVAGPQQKPKRQFSTWTAALLGGMLLLLCMVIAWVNGQSIFSLPPAKSTLAGQATTPFVPAEIKAETPVHSVTLWPTELPPTSTIAPTETATVTPFAPQEPGQFIVYYFETLIFSERNYDLAWSLLSEQYKSKANPNGIEEYKNTWGKVSEWRRPILTTTEVKPNTVLVTTPEIWFHGRDWYKLESCAYCLIRDESRNTWMIDTPSVCRP